MLSKELIETTDARVVLSSSWRNSNYLTDKVRNSLATIGVRLYGVTPMIEVIPETCEEYTNLTDKNGVGIFEGDIVTMSAYGGGKHQTVVYFKNGKFAVDGSNYKFKDIAPKGMEIIGNIHDNIELLKKGKREQ